MRCAASLTIALVACGGPVAPSRATPPVGYAGVTTCGAAVPEPAEPRLRAEPAREPMPWQAPAPPPPPPAPTAPEPSAGAIDRAMRGQMPQLRACAVRFYDRHAGEGTLRLDTRFAIGTDGGVTGAVVAGVEAELDRCVCDRLLALTVPGSGAPATVGYPLTMSP